MKAFGLASFRHGLDLRPMVPVGGDDLSNRQKGAQ
jgi:hypothetical protein